MDFTFDIAQPEDDPALRRLLASSAMPGRITVTFEREPNYFLGCSTMGQFWQVLVARHTDSGEIAGVLCRGVRPHFVNGQVQNLGYIGQIRVAEKFRGQRLLSRGLAYFRSLHSDGRVKAYWGVISHENAIARHVLVDKRPTDFPITHEIAQIYTLGIIIRKPLKPIAGEPPIERGSTGTLPEIIAFLRQQGASSQLFPAYDVADFNGGALTLGFDVRDFLLVRKQGKIAGVIGLWDQSAYKQTVVRGYAPSLQCIRPFYNLGASLFSAQPLPAQGQHIHSAYASFFCVAEHDRKVSLALLRSVYNLAAERRFAYLMLGLVEGDPFLPEAKTLPHIAYHSQLYVGCWDEGLSFFQQLDGRMPYTEIAAL